MSKDCCLRKSKEKKIEKAEKAVDSDDDELVFIIMFAYFRE